VARSSGGLLAQVESRALDSSTSLADTLRKCIALGGQAGSADLRDWARKELDGYKGDDELPPYRVLTAPLKIDGTTDNTRVIGQQLSTFDIPDFAREAVTSGIPMMMGIAELERLSRSRSETRLQPPMMQDLVSYMNTQQYAVGHITTMYWAVSSTAILGAVDAVRTNLVALVAEMRAAGESSETIPTADVAQHAVQVVIHGARRSPITVNNAQAANGASVSVDHNSTSPDTSRIPGWIRGPWGFVVGLGTLVGAYVGVASAASWPPF